VEQPGAKSINERPLSRNMRYGIAMSMLSAYRDDLLRLERSGRLRGVVPRRGKDFSSNDYLGLAGSRRIADAIESAIRRGVAAGSGGSRLLRGNDPEHEALEAEAALFFGSGAALFFASGYLANIALFSTLPQRGDLVVHDERIHASAHDGMRLGRASAVAAAHNDANAVEAAILAWRRGGGRGRPWIAVESLYSMDGDRAPLPDLVALADRHEAFLMIDEAHATGVFGPGGRGLTEDLAAEDFHGRDNVVTLHTCGKALGCEGALVCCPAILRDFLVNRGRPFIFTTSPSPLIASAVRESLRIVAGEPERRERLWRLVRKTEAALASLGVAPTGSQIVPILLGGDGVTMRTANAIQAAGFDVRGIRPPTVPEGMSRLRISLTLNVDETDIAALAEAIGAALG
jgi:8-amino-7-oxononanoate synthase